MCLSKLQLDCDRVELMSVFTAIGGSHFYREVYFSIVAVELLEISCL